MHSNSTIVGRTLRIHPEDNVLVALAELHQGELIDDGRAVVLRSDIPAKHKFVTRDLVVDDPVVMYGTLVGRATRAIAAGEVVTLANVRHDSAPARRRSQTLPKLEVDVSRWKAMTFFGYKRSDGQIGTRNYWLVLPLVFCENRNIEALRQAFIEELGYASPSSYRATVAELVRQLRAGRTKESEIHTHEVREKLERNRPFPNVDGIKFLTHQGGCGGTRDDARSLCGLLAGYIHHPNVAGATVLSLGCQHAQVALLREELEKRDQSLSKPVLIFDQQRAGTEAKLMSDAIRETFSGLVEVDNARRTPAPLSALTVGLKCGGSDGFSGISANPTVGHVADKIAALGGKAILSEFPELCGVEQELVDRCVSDEAASRFLSLMEAYQSRAQSVGSGFDMNPSPGNIRDGLVTDAMKSAGAAKKGGRSPINDVLDFPEYAVVPGLNLLCTPGNDVESVTAQVGSGANIVLFTTGLGTPTGNPIAPVVKIASNSALTERMPDIIDFDCGPIISGEANPESLSEELLEMMLRVGSGELKTKAELLGQDDFIPWKRGVSL